MWQEYLQLLQDPAHILFELTMTIIIDLCLLGFAVPHIRNAIVRHDREAHGIHQGESECQK